MQTENANDRYGREGNPVPRPDIVHRTRLPNRQRACVQCRATKTRCIPLADRDSCKACFKNSRVCSMPTARKPRATTAQKYSDLERKIEVLSMQLSMNAKLGSQHMQPLAGSVYPSEATESQLPSGTNQPESLLLGPVSSISRKQTQHGAGYKSLVTEPEAQILYNHWKHQMHPFLPFLDLPPESTPEELQSTKPLLLLAILTVASSSLMPNLRQRLLVHLNDQLTTQAYIANIQSVDLVQAMLVYSQYYIPLEKPMKFVFTQHTYTASIMCYDLGLDKRAKNDPSRVSKDAANATRTWLASYYIVSLSTSLLSRQQFTFDNEDIDRLVEYLSNHKYSTFQDRRLCALVRLQQIRDDISLTTGASKDGQHGSAFDQSFIPHQLKMLHRRLDEWEQRETDESDSRIRKLTYHSIRFSIYQVAIRRYLRLVFTSREEGPAPDDLESSLPVSHIRTLCICVESSLEILKSFIGMDTPLIRSLPTALLVRVLLAAIGLTKLARFVNHLPNLVLADDMTSNGLSSVISATDLFDTITAKLSHVCQKGFMSQAQPFLLAFQKLNVWYKEKRSVCIHSPSDRPLQEDRQTADLFDRDESSVPNGQGTGTGGESTGAAEGTQQQRQSSQVEQAPPEHLASQGVAQAMGFSFVDSPLPDVFGNGDSTSSTFSPSMYDNLDVSDFTFDDETMKEFDDYILGANDELMKFWR